MKDDIYSQVEVKSKPLDKTKPNLYIIVGLPRSSKSTFFKNNYSYCEYLSRDEIRKRIMTRLPYLASKVAREPFDSFKHRYQLLAVVDPGFQTRIGVHYGLFYSTILGQGTDAQIKYWTLMGPEKFEIIGCFGMTELGHGSNVAGLETTATFVKATDEFIIHSPTMTSAKWWKSR